MNHSFLRTLCFLILWPWAGLAQPYLNEFPLKHQGKHFEFYYKRNTERIKAIARFADGFVMVVNRDFFRADFEYPIKVLVLENRSAFHDFLKRTIRMKDPPNFGVYFTAAKVFITFEDSGLGTFAHEIMHPLVDRNLKDRPLWALEGIPTFFEKFYGHWQGEELVAHWGFHNPWRIHALGTNLTNLDLNALLRTTNSQGEFRESDIRMISMFLWEQGKFQRFLQLVQSKEKSGYDSYFEAALEMPLEQIIPHWRKYLADVAAQRTQIAHLPASAILDDEDGFHRFAEAHKLPLAHKSGENR